MIVRAGSKTVRKNRAITPVVRASPYGYKQYNQNGGLVSTGATFGSFTTQSRTEEIVYTTRPRGNNGFLHSNMCVHKKNSYYYSGNMDEFQIINIINDPGHAGWYYQYWSGHGKSIIAHASCVAAAKAALGTTLGTDYVFSNAQAWINDATSKSKPDLTRLDALNFAVQAGAIADLYGTFKQHANLVSNVGSNYLALKFGLLPDIGDVQAAVAGVLNFRSKLDAFDKARGTIVRNRVVLVGDSIVKTGLLSPPYETNSHTTWRAVLARKVEAFIYYRPERIESFGEVDRAFRGSLATFGVELNPRVAWDAIPFSFVVDWFFNVGKVLEQFKINALELPVTYIDSAIQYKQQLTIGSETSLDVGSSVSTSTSWPTSTTIEDVFFRWPIFADYTTLSQMGFRMPTTSQATLLLALGATLTA